MTLLTRHIAQKITDSMKISPIVFINGPRQAGKSTFVHGFAEEMKQGGFRCKYVSFDQAIMMAAAASAPEAFLSEPVNNLIQCLIVDEVQLIPEIFRPLKTIVDNLRLENKANSVGRYLLTGSVNIMSLPTLSDALVGRMSVATLYPYSVAEAIQCPAGFLERLLAKDFTDCSKSTISLTDAMLLATFPDISGKENTEQALWMDSYLTTLLQRDVKNLSEIDKISQLPNLLRALAARAGNLMNDADIARDVRMNPVTTKTYRTILQMMFLTIELPAWFRNIGKRFVKSTKGYFIDTRVLCHILGLQLEGLRQRRPELLGHIVENFVATELLKNLSIGKINAQLYHFRTQDGKEVDFVLEKQDGSVFGIEVKTSESVNIHDFKGLQMLQAIMQKDFLGGIVLYAGKDVVPFGPDLWAVPLHFLWV